MWQDGILNINELIFSFFAIRSFIISTHPFTLTLEATNYFAFIVLSKAQKKTQNDSQYIYICILK